MFNPVTGEAPLKGDPKKTESPNQAVGKHFNHASDVPPCGKGAQEKAGGSRSNFNTTGLHGTPPL